MTGRLGAAIIVAAFLPVHCLAQEADAGSAAVQSPTQDVTISFNLPGEGSKWTPVDLSQGLPLVPVEIAGQPSCALIDTTASRTIVDLDLVRIAGLETVSSDLEFSLNGSAQDRVRRVLDVPVSAPGQFELRANLAGADLPGIACADGGEVGLVLGGDLLEWLAFAIHPQRGRIVFAGSGGINPTSDRFVRIEWKDGLVVGTIDKQPVLLEVATASAAPLYVYEDAFESVFPGSEIEQLGEGGKLGRPSAEIAIGDITATAPAIRVARTGDGAEEHRADARIGFGLIEYFVTVFDRGAGRILIRVPDLPESANGPEPSDD